MSAVCLIARMHGDVCRAIAIGANFLGNGAKEHLGDHRISICVSIASKVIDIVNMRSGECAGDFAVHIVQEFNHLVSDIDDFFLDSDNAINDFEAVRVNNHIERVGLGIDFKAFASLNIQHPIASKLQGIARGKYGSLMRPHIGCCISGAAAEYQHIPIGQIDKIVMERPTAGSIIIKYKIRILNGIAAGVN